MKVLFVLSSTLIHGGGSKAFMQMLDGLISLGVEPIVVFPNKDGLFYVLQNKNIRCIATKFNYRSSVYPICKSLKDKLLFIPKLIGRLVVNNLAAIQLIKIVKQIKPDIIHTNVSVIAIGFYVARLLNIPHVWHIREYGDADFHYYYYPTKRIQLRRYRVPNSYTVCITKDIQQYNNLKGWSKSRVIYDGVLSLDSQKYILDKKRYFLFAGSLQHAKGILPLIDAYAIYCQLYENPLPLYVAGGGTEEYIQQVTEKINNYGLNSSVILLGVRKDILTLYSEATALIVPSLSEGFGFITAEAMFSGCLVVGNNTAGTKEQFDNGKDLTGNEIALRYTTQDELVKHLLDITINTSKYYESMILRGQQVVAQLYSSEKHADLIYNFYKEILGK